MLEVRLLSQVEQMSDKILENPSNYCGLQVGTEWSIQKSEIKRARKNLNKLSYFKINFLFWKGFKVYLKINKTFNFLIIISSLNRDGDNCRATGVS